MNIPGTDEQHAVALAATTAVPTVVWHTAGWGWAVALVVGVGAVAALIVLAARVRARRALVAFRWRHLPRGRRHLPAGQRP